MDGADVFSRLAFLWKNAEKGAAFAPILMKFLDRLAHSIDTNPMTPRLPIDKGKLSWIALAANLGNEKLPTLVMLCLFSFVNYKYFRIFASRRERIDDKMRKVKPKKNLGQHFLVDLDIARRIADTVDAYPAIPVLEIGPGMGVLTQYLAEKPRELKVVEIDKESVAFLYGQFPLLRDKIIGDDFLRMDLHDVFGGRQFVLTGNYPYDISSQIFFKMLDNRDLIPCCTGMIQREVALRMASPSGTKAYGILSVLTQAWYDVEYLFTVDEHVFNPPPKVKSAVIRMTRNDVDDLGCDEVLFKRLVKAVFNQRRKMLRVSLKQLVAGRDLPDGFFEGKFMTQRPEELGIAEFVELTNIIGEVLK